MTHVTSIAFTAKERKHLLEILMGEIDAVFQDLDPAALTAEEWEMFIVANQLFEKHLLMYHVQEQQLDLDPSFLAARHFYHEYKDALVVTTKSFGSDFPMS